MGNITDITTRLPIRQFTPRIYDHSLVDAYQQAPHEFTAENQRVIIAAACRELASQVGGERMLAEVAAIAGFAHAEVSK